MRLIHPDHCNQPTAPLCLLINLPDFSDKVLTQRKTAFTPDTSELMLAHGGPNTFSQRSVSTNPPANTSGNCQKCDVLAGALFSDLLDVTNAHDEIANLMGPWPYLEPTMGKTSNSGVSTTAMSPSSTSTSSAVPAPDSNNSQDAFSNNTTPQTTPGAVQSSKGSGQLRNPTQHTSALLDNNYFIPSSSPMEMTNNIAFQGEIQSNTQDSTPDRTQHTIQPGLNSTTTQAIGHASSTQVIPSGLPIPSSDPVTTQATTHQGTPSVPQYLSGAVQASPGTNQPKFTSTLSLASTTTNRPPPASFAPLRPIHHWVPPRPTTIRRTSPPPAERAAMRAEHAARQAEKAAEAQRKEAEMKILREGAKKSEEVEKEKRAKALQERERQW